MASVIHLDTLASTSFDDARRATYVALDVETESQALDIVEALSPAVDGYKVGLELFHRTGTRLLDQLLSRNLRIFLDMKLHDIPNTVAGALRAICQYPIEMVNVHALGGRKMLEAAREAVNKSPYQPLLTAVTLLTSLGEDDIEELGLVGDALSIVDRLTQLASSTGLDGVVCSAQELAQLATRVPTSFERVVPGTRLIGDSFHDQRRTRTPHEAIQLGATRLVLGRAVTRASNPLEALHAYWQEMRKE